jgi:hypothetical protein
MAGENLSLSRLFVFDRNRIPARYAIHDSSFDPKVPKVLNSDNDVRKSDGLRGNWGP